jgi:hypothetical protein
MRLRYPSILILLSATILFACQSVFVSDTISNKPVTSSFQSTNTVSLIPIPSSTTTPTKTSSSINVGSLRYIAPSLILNDNRIWAMGPMNIDEKSCNRTSGEIYQSNDGGRNWELVAPPILFSLGSWCGSKIVADIGTTFDLIPYRKGLILQLRVGGTILPSQSPIFYWDGSVWNRIFSPIQGYKNGVAGQKGLTDMIVIPDGSGRIFAVGDDPDKISNVWMLDTPLSSWKDISLNLSPNLYFEGIIWSYAFGLVGASENTSSVYRLDSETRWVDLQYPKGIKPPVHMWMGINGAICTANSLDSEDLPNYGWDGEIWSLYNRASVCPFYGPYVAFQKFAAIKVFPHQPGDPSGWYYISLNENQVNKLELPKVSPDAEIRGLRVSQTGIIYVLYTDSLYSSSDIGKTWELLNVT